MRKLLFALIFIAKVHCETVGVVGSGYVGLVMSSLLAKWGHQVVCIDIDEKRVDLLQKKILPIFEPELSELLFESSRIVFSSDIEQLKNVPLLYICVGTPSDEQGNCDCSAIYAVADQIAAMNNEPKVLCVKSTVAPGTIRRLEERVSKAPIDVVYNPEFMREGSAIKDIHSKNPVVLGSRSQKALQKVEKFYEPLLCAHPELEVIRTTPETAELIKYGWNGFSAIRLSYIHELSRLSVEYGADIEALVRGISWSERLLQTQDITPGCGYGGSCLPKDTLGLSRIFEKNGASSTLAHQAIRSNQHHIETLLSQAAQFIGPTPQKIAILGAAFKENTDDIRYAPSLSFIRKLQDLGHQVQVYDAHALNTLKKECPEAFCCNDLYQTIEGCHCIIALTPSEEIRNLDLMRASCSMQTAKIIDYRNLFSPQLAKEAGFSLINLGRLY